MTAEEIHRLARGQISSLGISTVYRSIRGMLEEQQLVSVDFPGQPPRYELPTGKVHSHFICSRCEKVFDLARPPGISGISLPAGFHLHGYEFVVFGFCADCEREEAERKE